MVALGRRVRASLADARHWIRQHGLLGPSEYENLAVEFSADEFRSSLMQHDSPIGRLTHLAPIVQMSETPARWSRPAVPRGFNQPAWPERE